MRVCLLSQSLANSIASFLLLSYIAECTFGVQAPSRDLPILLLLRSLVQIDCKGCEERVRTGISELDGVTTIDIDLDSQKVTVTGYLDQREILKAVRRAVKKAEFWPSPYDNQYHPFALQYMDQQTFELTYNYYVHWYNGSSQGCLNDLPYSIDDSRFHMFSEKLLMHATYCEE